MGGRSGILKLITLAGGENGLELREGLSPWCAWAKVWVKVGVRGGESKGEKEGAADTSREWEEEAWRWCASEDS